MKRLLQINITANWGSHGKIAEGIGLAAMRHGWESHIAYGRWKNPSRSQLYHIGSSIDESIHGISSRIFDNHGLMSHIATHNLIRYIHKIGPDIIHLHNIHGYYLNYPILFAFLTKSNIPVVWTLHDCWPYTGHCAHYMFANCDKWKTHCRQCPLKANYPRSIFADRSYKNFEQKRQAFLSLANLTLVPVSKWLERELRQSFFKESNIRQIYNGIDVETFRRTDNPTIREKYDIANSKKVVLGIASNWHRKGLQDFARLRSALDDQYEIVLVGVRKEDAKRLPNGIHGIQRTEDTEDLKALYSTADVYFNPTWEDNFPTTILESLACGTPVVTYNTGGCGEAIEPETGRIIERGDLPKAVEAISLICSRGKESYSPHCRNSILSHFQQDSQYEKYIQLYSELIPTPSAP